MCVVIISKNFFYYIICDFSSINCDSKLNKYFNLHVEINLQCSFELYYKQWMDSYLRNKNEKRCIIAYSNAECHRAIIFITKPRSGEGDKFDRSMTRGKLLGNNAPLFIFISILIMTQLHPRDQKTDKRTDSRNGEKIFHLKSQPEFFWSLPYLIWYLREWIGIIQTTM